MEGFKFSTILLISFLAVQVGKAQLDSYILLDDPSGMGPLSDPLNSWTKNKLKKF